MNFLDYANQGAIRNQPLSPRLTNALSYLDDMGLTMEVFSGGQPEIGTSDRRVGSTRHDGGNAADVFFLRDGRRLDWANPEHLPVFQEVVSRGRQNGLTGFGAGEGYMRPGSMHLGFGTEAVWGADGKGANAPQWLRDAYYGAPQGEASPVVVDAPQPAQERPQGAMSLNNVLTAMQYAPRYESTLDASAFMNPRNYLSNG